MHKLLVTSMAAHEGKSTICSRLAKERSDNGERVLLVDLDSMESARIGLGNGLAECIRSRGSISADIVEEDNYDVLLPSRNRTRISFNPREMSILEELLGTLEEYDTAVIDTPPIWHVPEVLNLCRYCDEIIVVDSGISGIDETLARFEKAGIHADVLRNYFDRRAIPRSERWWL